MKITWIANFIIHILNQRILIQIGVKMRWVSGITMFYHQTFLKLPVWQQFIISKGHFQKCESCIHDFITFHETNSKSPWKWMLGWEFAYFSGSKMHEHHGGQKPFSSRLTSSFLFGIPTYSPARTCQSNRSSVVRNMWRCASWSFRNPKIRLRHPKELKELLNLHSSNLT